GARLGRIPYSPGFHGQGYGFVQLQQSRAPAATRAPEGCDRSPRHPVGRPLWHLAQTPAETFVKLALAGTPLLLMLGAGAFAAAPTISWTWFPVKEPANAPPGKIEFDRACAVCHGVGPDRPGTSSLQVKYQGKLPALLEERTDLTPEAVRYFI